MAKVTEVGERPAERHHERRRWLDARGQTRSAVASLREVGRCKGDSVHDRVARDYLNA